MPRHFYDIIDMKGEEDNWQTAYQEMRPCPGLVWPRALITLDLPADCCRPLGEDSQEVKVQRAREAQELMVIYKDSRMAPESPREPQAVDMDYDDSKTPLIHWNDQDAAPSPSPSSPNISQFQSLFQMTQPQIQLQPTQAQGPAMEAILSLLGNQPLAALNEMVATSHSNNMDNIGFGAVNPNTSMYSNFSSGKGNSENGLESGDKMNNQKNFPSFNMNNLGNMLSQFSANGSNNFFNGNNAPMSDHPRQSERDHPRPGPGERGKYGRMCTYFNTQGGCRNGNLCKFAHVQPISHHSMHSNSGSDDPPNMPSF